MKLERLRFMREAVLSAAANDWAWVEGYFFHKDSWHQLDKSKVINLELIGLLTAALGEPVSAYKKAGVNAWFGFPEYDFVICLSFDKAPQSKTRHKVREKLNKLISAAHNEYKVDHHHLTDLLAKEAFLSALDRALGEVGTGSSFGGGDTPDATLPRAVAVMALDIDYFKQVNDTWGHAYGDKVLKAFGRRLERYAESIVASGIGRVSVHVGHPSGEEFLVVITANAPKSKFSEWASGFRHEIIKDVLPSESEWSDLICEDGQATTPPALHERVITASIGVTWHTNVSKLSGDGKVSAVLLDRADAALYRAKAAGRNQVIFFDEILASCGRIIECELNAGVFAVDIGSNVGVKAGQEFSVYSPKFSGQVPFTVNDGRTVRTVGAYPKVESGRVVVFNVQPEISFAYFSTSDGHPSQIELGSRLEAIPAGSFTHLLPSFSKYFPGDGEAIKQDGLARAREYLSSESSSGRTPFAVVLRLSREGEYVRKHGTASLNVSLARVFKLAQAKFQSAKFVEVLDKSSICIVGSSKSYNESVLAGFVDELCDDFPELGVRAGCFCKADKDGEDLVLGASPLQYENAIEFARFAASESGWDDDKRIRHFTYSVAISILRGYRESNALKTGYADYLSFVRLGVSNAPLHNLAGLICGSMGDEERELEHYRSAVELAPEIYIYRSNYCTSALFSGKYEQGLSMMQECTDEYVDQLNQAHPFGCVCYAISLAKAKLSGSKLFDIKRFMNVAPKAMLLEKDYFGDEFDLIGLVYEQL